MVVTHPPPSDYSTGLPGPGCYWCLPPSIVPRVLLGCHDIEWGVSGSLFTSLRFHGGTKGFALCGVLLPSTPLWSVLALLCAAALRYSSLMFQVPLWTSTKAREYPLWSLRALSPPVRCCLPAPFLYNCTCSVLFLWLDLHWMNDATILAQGTFIAFAFCLLHMFFFALVYVSRAFKICGMFQLQIFQFFTCVNQSRGSGFTLFFFFCGFLPGRAWGVMDRARIPQQSTATLFSWLLIILTELCRRFGVDLGTVVIECFEVNYPVPPAAVPAPCQSRCAICGSPCSRHSPAHLQHRCADHRRNQ